MAFINILGQRKGDFKEIEKEKNEESKGIKNNKLK